MTILAEMQPLVSRHDNLSKRVAVTSLGRNVKQVGTNLVIAGKEWNTKRTVVMQPAQVRPSLNKRVMVAEITMNPGKTQCGVSRHVPQ